MEIWTAALFLGLACAAPTPTLHHEPATVSSTPPATDALNHTLNHTRPPTHTWPPRRFRARFNVSDYAERVTGNGTAGNETRTGHPGYLVVHGAHKRVAGTTGQQTGVIVIGVFLLVAVVTTMGIAIHQNRQKSRSGEYRLPHPTALRPFPYRPPGSAPGSPKASTRLPLTSLRPLPRAPPAPAGNQSGSSSDPAHSSWTDVSVPPNSPTRLTRSANTTTTQSEEDAILSAFPHLAEAKSLFAPTRQEQEEDDDVTATTYRPTPSVHTALTSSPCPTPSTARPMTSPGSPSLGFPVLPSRSSAQFDDDSSSEFLWESSSYSNDLPPPPVDTPGARRRMAAVVEELRRRQGPTPSTSDSGHTPSAAHLGTRAPHSTPNALPLAPKPLAPKPPAPKGPKRELTIDDLWPDVGCGRPLVAKPTSPKPLIPPKPASPDESQA